MSAWMIFVPAADEYGDEFPMDHHHCWDTYVMRMTKGMTIMRSAKGSWVTSQYKVDERVIPVVLVCTREQIEEIVSFTLEHYDQHEVLAVKMGDEFILAKR